MCFLIKNNVGTGKIQRLADKLVSFHRTATVVTDGVDRAKLYEEFEGIGSVRLFLVRHFGEGTGKFIERMNGQAYRFLENIKERIVERNGNGSVIDGHGDLHARNIFLLDEPVIFDCIEFNDAMKNR